MPKINFLPSGVVCDAKIGESILDVALANGVPIQHACGGFCACTTCQCEIVEGQENLRKPESEELDRLELLDDRTSQSRLACQSKVMGDVTVKVINQE